MNSFMSGFMDELEKLATPPERLIRALGGVKNQIRRMGIPVVRGGMPMTLRQPSLARINLQSTMMETDPRAANAIKNLPNEPAAAITSASKRMLRKDPFRGISNLVNASAPPDEIKGARKELRGFHKKILAKDPAERRLQGLQFLHHEKTEAKALRGQRTLLGDQPGVGHVHPSVIQREGRLIGKIREKYPNFQEHLIELRRKEPGLLEEKGMLTPEWKQTFKDYFARFDKK